MIKLYTDIAVCGKLLVDSNDKYFSDNVNSSYLDKQCRALVYKVDGAEILDEFLMTVSTRLGLGDVRNLSTGVKTLINIYNLIKRGKKGVVNVQEVGENLVLELFNLVDDTDIGIFVGEYNIPGILDEQKDFLLNEKLVTRGTVNLRHYLADLKRRNR